MGAKLGSSGGPMAEINVTPLIDVVLVLLVVFMVITPMLQSGMPVNLPEAATTTTVNDVGQFVVVSITKDGSLAVEQDRLDSDDELIMAIITKMRENPDRTILIKADRDLEYRRVREVMDMLTPRGWTSLKIAAASEK